MAINYDIWLVLLSLAASGIAMFTIFGFIERLYLSPAHSKNFLLPIYTATIGSGLLGIHFINWLALHRGTGFFEFSIPFMTASWACALLIGFITCIVASKKTVTLNMLLMGGLIASLSSYSMHYFCAIALHAPANFSNEPIATFIALLLSLSVCVLTIITLSLMKIYTGGNKRFIKIIFSLVTAFTVIGLHIAFSASIVGQENALTPTANEILDRKMLVMVISLAIVCLFLLVFVAAIYYEKYVGNAFKFGATIQQKNAVSLEIKDPLTNLPNRAAFRQLLETSAKRNTIGGKTIALAYIDLDHFKPINDKFGHHVGDSVLTVVAERLQAAVRECDVVARLGGDEFSALIEDIESDEDIIPIIKRILDSINTPIFVNSQKIEISCSMGIALYPRDGDIDKLIICADTAMYIAKESGKNQFKFYDSEIASASNKTLELQRDLHAAIKKQEFILLFQPKLDCKTKLVVGAEALIRWNHPTKGMILPSEFIAVAEHLGLIDHINDWVIESACAAIKQAKKHGLDLHLSLNLSRQQFRNSNLVEKTVGWLTRFDVPAHHITFEIKETVAMKNEMQFKTLLNQIKAANIKIALDDFGLHPLTLNYLKDLNVNEVKLDKTFITKIGESSATEALVEGIIHLAHKLSFNVVAEGVETEAQHDAVVRMGCNHMQGYLFSKPLTEADLYSFYKKQLSLTAPLQINTDNLQPLLS